MNLGIRVTIIASLLISCHLLALLSYEFLALTFFTQPNATHSSHNLQHGGWADRRPKTSFFPPDADHCSHQALIIVPTRRCTQSATMWWLLKGFLSLALGLLRSRHYDQDAFCQDDICHEDDSGYDDQRESGESVHCAGLHEAVGPTVPWQVRGLHQLDALAHFGGTLQVLQFLIGTGWYLFSTIRCSILTQSCPIRIPATYSTTVLHPSVIAFYNIIVIIIIVITDGGLIITVSIITTTIIMNNMAIIIAGQSCRPSQ